MLTKILSRCSLIIFALHICGCATSEFAYDPNALTDAKTRSILVLHPLNKSTDANASYKYLSTISNPLAEKGYYVFPVTITDLFLQENGLQVPEKMEDIQLEKIRDRIGADAVLHVTIHNWGQKYTTTSSSLIVSATLSLIDTQTGKLLWQGEAKATKTSNTNSDGSLNGMINSSLIDKFGSSSIDYNHSLSSKANRALILGKKGPVKGPYHPDTNQ